jgi:hypothetical protein
LLDVSYVVAVGGDYMHGRLLLLALFAFRAPVAMVPATRPHAGAIAIALRPPESSGRAECLRHRETRHTPEAGEAGDRTRAPVSDRCRTTPRPISPVKHEL